ncbi:MAG TPA: hypothetical protein VE871_20420 [Longimicrobium sp.]|nr:hypothetical protein [Longimicrobium sp.]
MHIRSVLHATTLVLLASCNPITQSCTLIGCEDGLAVRLSSVPAGAYRVEAWSELRIAPQVFECAAGQTCAPIFFPAFEGHDVMVRVTTAAGVRTQEFDDVEYERLYPNGRRCGGACAQATVTVQL